MRHSPLSDDRSERPRSRLARHASRLAAGTALVTALALAGGCAELDYVGVGSIADSEAAGDVIAHEDPVPPPGPEDPAGAPPASEHPEPADDPGQTPEHAPVAGPDPEFEPHLGAPEVLVSRAHAALPTLEIKGRAPQTGYSRDEFGPAWTDDVSVAFGRNGCDTRNDILARDLVDLEFRDDCVVESGVLHDPFTGTRIDFVRGPDTSQDVQIDHVVSLSDAWQKGAQQLSEAERQDFANDPLNLLAVDGPANQAKGDGDVATWLPPNRDFRCAFVAIHVVIKERWNLWMTHAEHEAASRVLAGC